MLRPIHGLPLLALTSLAASERTFTYVHDSAVAAPGTKEVEVWHTTRRGRADVDYNRAINRLELEVGLTERLQTAIYLNFSRETVDGVSEEEHSASWEWKYKAADNAADPVGLALYGETTTSSDEFELEFKTILDKRMGAELFAFNATYEAEWSIVQNDSGLREHGLEFTLGWSHRFNARFAAGIEARNHNEIEKEVENGETEWEWESSALFIGPAFHGSFEDFWCTATVMPQVYAFASQTDDGVLDLEHHERLEIRVIAGIHF